jgi:hypothetical protein
MHSAVKRLRKWYDGGADLNSSEAFAADVGVLLTIVEEQYLALVPFAEAYRRQGEPADYAGCEALGKHFARAAALVPPEPTP